MERKKLVESKNTVESDLCRSKEILRDSDISSDKYSDDYIKAVKSIVGIRENVLAKIESEIASLDAEQQGRQDMVELPCQNDEDDQL